MTLITKFTENLADSAMGKLNCEASLKKSLSEISFGELPRRLACESLAGMPGSISSAASDINGGAKWASSLHERPASETGPEVFSASAGVVLMGLTFKGNTKLSVSKDSWRNFKDAATPLLNRFGNSSTVGGKVTREGLTIDKSAVETLVYDLRAITNTKAIQFMKPDEWVGRAGSVVERLSQLVQEVNPNANDAYLDAKFPNRAQINHLVPMPDLIERMKVALADLSKQITSK